MPFSLALLILVVIIEDLAIEKENKKIKARRRKK